MVTVSLQKTATIIREKGRFGAVSSHKHSDLGAALANDNEITVSYSFGQAARRVKQLQALGFTLKEVTWRNTDALHGDIREVWAR